MSSSKGHVELPDNAIQEYGADTTRFFIFASREPWQDFDWNTEDVEEYFNKIQNFYNRSKELYNTGEERENNRIDRYVLSRLQKITRDATKGMEDFQTRKSGLNGFFEVNSLINRYRNRAENLNKNVLNEVVETQIKLMAPFTPHICEELWEEIDKDGFVSDSEWPTPDQEKIDEAAESAEEFVRTVESDIRSLEELVDDDYEEIRIIVSNKAKRNLFREMIDLVEERPEFGEAMQKLIEKTESQPNEIEQYLKNYLESPGGLPDTVFDQDEEKEILQNNKEYLEEEFNTWIKIDTEEESGDQKAERAEPGKPAIIME
jgi:leucyl-tRNA synthetase